jgi:uncharacterized membrane protein
MQRELHPKKFFTKEEEAQIVAAIQEAEKTTSGEIRVHLTKEIKVDDPVKEAIRIFNVLKMYKTKERNGCLILIGLKNKKVAVIGDKGINEKVGENFWEDVVELIVSGFKEGNYVQGLSKAIIRIGEKLKLYFPYREDDVNELPDEISKEDI